MYFETNVAAIDSAESTLPQNMFIDNHDWMDTPSIAERYTGEVSYLELGGVAYTNYANGGDGSFSAILSSAPGETPAYRGKNLKMSGFALSTQGQANTLSGNIWESMNAQYPEVSLDMVGNYRNLDIAPQEKVTITLRADDTFRGLSWVQKAFTPTSMSWNYDPEKGTFLPSLTLKEITQGNAGETIAIPVEPPEEGFEQPPINVPPPIPPLPVPDISWTGTGYLGYAFAPFLGGFDQSANPLHWGSHLTTLAGLRIDGGQVMTAFGVPSGVTNVVAYPVVANNGAQVTLSTFFDICNYPIGQAGFGCENYDVVSTNFTYSATDLNWLSSHSVSISVTEGDVLIFNFSIDPDTDIYPWGALMLFS
jgi:hypothetical protein